MATILLGQEHRLGSSGTDQKMTKSFFASLAIHGGLVLALLIAAAIPHKLHFEQTALIELQNFAPGTSGGSGKGGTISSALPTPAVKTQAIQPKAAPVKAPKIATLKTKILPANPAQDTQTTPANVEKISLKHNAKETKTKESKTTPGLKERILQKFSSMNSAASAGAGRQQASAGSQTAPGGTQGVGAIGTDIPFPFAGYLADVQNLIAQQWEEPNCLGAKRDRAQAVVVFRIHHDGKLSNIILAIPSGITALDKSAMAAVEAANPLPPLPIDFTSDHLDVHLQFDLTQ